MWSLLLCFATGAWADEVTIDFSTKGYANGATVGSVEQDGITITFAKGSNSNVPKYYNDGTAVRAYGGNTFTVSSSNTITKIELTFASGGGSNAITADAGTFESPTWTGSTTSVMFTIGGTSGHRRIQKIVVTYNPPAGTPMAPTISGETPFVGSTKVTITNNEVGATIHYTTDGTDPTAASTAYSEPIELTETTTIKAIAVKDGVSSSVATATYTKLTLSTIAEAQAAEAGTMVAIEGVVVATAASGAVIKDDTDLIYYFNSNNALTVGQKIKMIGTVTIYGGAKQFSNTATIIDEGTETVTYPTPTTMTEAEFNGLTSATAVERKFVTYTGKLNISGNFYNITVGESAVKGSLVKPSADYSALDGKDVVVKGYQMYITGSTSKYVYTVATSVLELGSYEIKIVETDGLTITPDVTTAKAGEKVYASFVLEDHYRLEFPDFVDDDGQPIEFTDGETAGLEEVGGKMKMWFIMPEKNVTIKAKATKRYQLSVTPSENGTITVISVNMESDPYSKAEKDIHMMVTANEGYVIKSVEVKDANDAAVVVRAETGIHGEQAFNYVFTMPASNVKIGATIQKKPEDININPETGADISQALAAASEGKNVRNIAINLAGGASYTVGAAMEPGTGTFTINGNGATVTATVPLISLPATPVVEANPEKADFYELGAITIDNVKLSTSKAVVKSNAKYLVSKIDVTNSVIELTAAVTPFDFGGGNYGYPTELNMKNSTLWASVTNSKPYFTSQSGNSPKDINNGAEEKQTIAFENCTLYNICSGANFNNLRQKGQKFLVFTVKNNVIVNCGKDNFLQGMDGGQSSSTPTWTVDGNIFGKIVGGVYTDLGESQTGNGEVTNTIAGVLTFTNAAEGDFNGVVELPYGAAEPTSLGDGRWTLSYTHAPVEHTYIVAGNSDIFGTPWDPTNESNKMTNNGDGTYSKTYTVSEAVNDIQLKVVEDGTTWYGDAEGQNVVFDLSAAGSFTVNFDPATGIVTVTGDIVTGINAISADKAAENLENAEIYTLNGQRVEKPRKGLYIVNGKKVVIK